MSYKEALQAYGYEVLDYYHTDDYSGIWIAVLKSGEVVKGHFGSCSGCDDFEAFADYRDLTKEDYIKFMDEMKYPLESDYQKVFADLKWDCNEESAKWLKSSLIKHGFYKE